MIEERICPRCGQKLEHSREWNEEIFGTDDETNPYIGWVCGNEKCKGWYCDACEEYHPYGTSCSVSMIRNIRGGGYYRERDPNWLDREDFYHVKGAKILAYWEKDLDEWQSQAKAKAVVEKYWKDGNESNT